MSRKITLERCITPACDVPSLELLGKLISATSDFEKVGAYKLGFELVLDQGLRDAVDKEMGGACMHRSVYYNHAGGATDIPDVGNNFMAKCSAAGVDGVILSCLSGPVTAEAWVKAAKENGLEVIAELLLTHDQFFDYNRGYVSSSALGTLMMKLCSYGVDKFILPELDDCVVNYLTSEKRSAMSVLFDYDAKCVTRRRDGSLDSDIVEVLAPDVMRIGLPRVVAEARKHTDKPLIYDHQKAATSTPEIAQGFAKAVAQAGIDYAIIFPQAGPFAEKEFIREIRSRNVQVIVGGEMTHKGYLVKDGGVIIDSAPEKMYSVAADMGVNDFVVPGNKADRIKHYHDMLTGMGCVPHFHSPGLVAQGGDLSEAANAAGQYWNAICGRAVFNPNNRSNLYDVTREEIRESVARLVSKL